MMQTEMDRVYKETEDKMKTAIDSIKKQFATVRTGRAHPALVEALKIDYYGTMTPLKQLASISTPEPRLIVIQPWDKNSIGVIEKSLLASDIGISPVNDGKFIRLSMPQLTAERRDELTKVLHRVAEEGKVSLRNARHHAIDEAAKLEKDNKMTEDDKFDTKDKVQKLTEKYTEEIAHLLKDKEKEIQS